MLNILKMLITISSLNRYFKFQLKFLGGFSNIICSFYENRKLNNSYKNFVLVTVLIDFSGVRVKIITRVIYFK